MRTVCIVSVLMFGCSSTTNIVLSQNSDSGVVGDQYVTDAPLADSATVMDSSNAADGVAVDSGPLGESVYPLCTSAATDNCNAMGTDAILLPDFGFCRGSRPLPASTGHAVLSLIVDATHLTCSVKMRVGVVLNEGPEANTDVTVNPGDSLVTIDIPTPSPGPLVLRLTNTGSCGQIIARTSPLHFYP